jgi:hypothetical protein
MQTQSYAMQEEPALIENGITRRYYNPRLGERVESEMAFSEETIRKALANAGNRCECTRTSCGHPKIPGGTRCTRDGFTWANKGSKWEAHHRVAVASGGSDALSNCEILCGPSTKEGTCHYNVHH